MILRISKNFNVTSTFFDLLRNSLPNLSLHQTLKRFFKNDPKNSPISHHTTLYILLASPARFPQKSGQKYPLEPKNPNLIFSVSWTTNRFMSICSRTSNRLVGTSVQTEFPASPTGSLCFESFAIARPTDR